MGGPYYPTCPHCGQRLITRHGVSLTPLLAAIFDIVERAGERGVMMEALVAALPRYRDRPEHRARAAVKNNIIHLNDRLVTTDMRVRTVPSHVGPYRLIVERRATKIGSAA